MITIECLSLHEVTVRFGERTILDRLSFSVEEGSVCCIMGASGSGKTTLMRVMMGLLSPDEGTLLGFSGKRRSAVFQENRLCENLSVRANLRMVCPAAQDAVFEEVLSALGISGMLRCPVRLLSGGMQRRVSLARALLSPYELLFLDEPFTGLDDATRDAAISLLKQKTKGKTVFLVTHSAEIAEALSDQLIRLSEGS